MIKPFQVSKVQDVKHSGDWVCLSVDASTYRTRIVYTGANIGDTFPSITTVFHQSGTNWVTGAGMLVRGVNTLIPNNTLTPTGAARFHNIKSPVVTQNGIQLFP